MLRLLAQREQGYEDIAALMGLSVEDVRARVKGALAQLEEEEEAPAESGEPAEPAPEATTQRTAKASEAAPEKRSVAAGPEEPAPAPPAASPLSPPTAPPEASPPTSTAATAKAGGRGRVLPRLPEDPGARAALVAGLIALVVLAVVLIVSGGGGEGASTGSGEGGGGAEAATPAQTASTSSKELTKAVLTPVAGGEGEGEAVFGRFKSKLALQVTASGLKPTTQGEAYTIWIAASPRKMLPLASAKANTEGRIAARFEVPTEVLAYLANETFRQIVLSRTSDALLQASLAKATHEKKSPIYTGTPVLEGTITGPVVGAANK